MIMKNKDDFREYLLKLEDYYMTKYMRIKDSKPLDAEPEKRLSLLLGHIIEEYDDKHR
jgi:hypothetical protein